MSQRSITLSLITLLAGAAAGAALMLGPTVSKPPAAATTALAVTAPVQPAADVQSAAASTWRSVPEAYLVVEGATEADVRNESIDSLGNLGDGP